MNSSSKPNKENQSQSINNCCQHPSKIGCKQCTNWEHPTRHNVLRLPHRPPFPNVNIIVVLSYCWLSLSFMTVSNDSSNKTNSTLESYLTWPHPLQTASDRQICLLYTYWKVHNDQTLLTNSRQPWLKLYQEHYRVCNTILTSIHNEVVTTNTLPLCPAGLQWPV